MNPFSLQINSDLCFRAVHTSDADELFQLTEKNRSHLREWLPWLDRTRAVGDTLQFIDLCRNEAARNESLVCCVLLHGQIAGMISFNRIDNTNRCGSMGYWLSQDHEGKGIITRTCKALIEFGFAEYSLNRIEIRCAPGNRKSRAIPIRLGFKEEGTMRQVEWLYDHFVDHVVYGILRDEWRTIQRQPH
ncbi:MAG: GNAT family N-acetyltransferase [Limisphaerales bacterium]